MENTVRNHHSTTKVSKTVLLSLPLFISLLGGIALFSTASAADTTYQVQPGDSLSKIVAKNYPDVSRSSYNIIMQHILSSNSSAFSNKNINSLRLGKTINLTDKDEIEGLKPAPPKPVAINPIEFKKLQSKNSDLTNQIQALQTKLESLDNTQKIPSSTDNTSDNEKVLQTQVEELTASINELKNKNEVLSNADTTATEKTLSDSQAEVEQLNALITKLEADNEELSKTDTATIEKQFAEAQAQIEKQKLQINTLEIEKTALLKTSSNTETSSKQIEDLQSEIDLLNSLVAKYEADQEEKAPATDSKNTSSKQVEGLQAELELLQGLITKYEADQEESDALIKQLKETSSGSNSSAEPSINTSQHNTEIEKLTQENSSLKAALDSARTKAAEDSKAISELKTKLASSTKEPTQTATTTPPQKTEPTSGLKLSSLSWLLPLLAILIGLYLLSRLIKRSRDKKATEDFKTAMSTSVTSNTASAFGIDGSAPAPSSETPNNDNKPSNEDDSLEAGVKIDIAKAYIELNDIEAANEILQEVIVEGSTPQKEEAERLLK